MDLRAKLVLPLALGQLACDVPSTGAECFSDDQCSGVLMCIEGICTDQDDELPDDEDLRLDIGSSFSPEASCAEVRRFATNTGCEFWAVDLPNIDGAGNAYGLDIPADQTFAVVVANTSSDRLAHVEVFSGGSSEPLEVATVAELGTYAFLLPNAQSISARGSSLGRAFRVESDIPITAYQFQPLDNLTPVFSNDASALLPAHVLQRDYIAVTPQSNAVSVYSNGPEPENAPGSAFVTVVATQDGTTVELTTTAPLLPGLEGGQLNRGEALTILSDPFDSTASLSGTHVRSNNPVAVFSGSIAARVPADSLACCLDHVEHQLPPAVAFGTRYVVVPPPDPISLEHDPCELRLVGAFDGTELRYPGDRPPGAPSQLTGYREAVFQATEPFIVESADPAKPFMVAQLLFNNGEANPNGNLGDPALVALPSLEQLVPRYVFLTPWGYQIHAVNIVGPQGAEVTLDGASLGAGSVVGVSGGVTWSLWRASVGDGPHRLDASEPVGLTVFGYDRDVSYAYIGGSAVDVIADVPPVP